MKNLFLIIPLQIPKVNLVKILTKINLLLLTSVIALIATSIISNVFKSQELEHYKLVEEIKTLQTYANEALAFEKNFEKTFDDQELVYNALSKAEMQLDAIHSDLLKENASKIKEVSGFLATFRDSFMRMEGNVIELLSKKEQINMAIADYSSKYDRVVVRINEEMAGGLLTMTDVDTTLLQELKNDSLTAFTSINRIVVLVNMDLILEGNITRFNENYERVIRRLEIQQKNISLRVVSLEDALYQELSQQLTRTYTEILSLVPELKKIYTENQHISRDLQNHKTEISQITQQVTEQSEILRKQKNENVTILQFLGQGSIILFLLIGGYLFARSMTNPLMKLAKVARAVSNGDYSKELDITSRDEIGQLARDFSLMSENLKQSFELIDEQKEQYRSIFENAIEGIFQSSPDGNLLRVNRALAQISGYTSPEEMIETISNTKEQLYVHTSDLEKFVKLLETDGFVREFETMFKQKNGNIIPVLINAQAIYDEHRKSLIFQGMIENISERKRMEEYKIAKETAEKSDRAKSEFLAHMSHELRTPLNAIIGFAQILKRSDNLDSKQHENLNIINRSGEHLLSLINNVLDMSKIESGQISLNPSDFDLFELLNEVRDLFKIRSEKKNLSLQISIQNDLPKNINTDKEHLRQILVNLVSNSIKFTEKGSVIIRVSLEILSKDQNIDEIVFEIEDTGSGIAQEELNLIFEPFFQTKSKRRSQEGTGLGLAISSRFINLMGGAIDVQSKEEVGTTVKFTIPLVVGKPTKNQKKIVRNVVGLNNDPDENSACCRILIVDDISSNRQVLIQLLSPLGFDIKEAVNGDEAVSLCKDWRPHLIWMDIRMPKLNGYEATRQIKNLPYGRDAIVIAISASAFEDKKVEALAAGCDDFVAKPFKESEIFELMRKYLGLRYIYEDVSQYNSSQEKENQELTDQMLGELPTEWKRKMRQAITHLDLDQIKILIEQVHEQDKKLAAAIQKRIDQFDYEKILSLLA